MHDIFISYSRRDTDRMKQVYHYLCKAGLSVWIDEGIEPGTPSWRTSLSEAINNCSSVVVLFSPDSAQSTWVNRELDFAELKEKDIYPLLVRGDPKDALPFGYTTYQFIDIRSNEDLTLGLARLVRSLRAKLSLVSTVTSPQLNDAETEVPELDNDFQPIETTKVAEMLWKWVETEQVRLFVPATYKIEEPTHENWARNLLTMWPDKNSTYQMLQDEANWGEEQAGIPGTQFYRDKVISDMSGLTPMTGFFLIISLPSVFTVLTAIAPIVVSMLESYSKPRVTNYFKKIGNMTLVSSERLPAQRGVFLSRLVFSNETHKAHVYTFIPTMNNKVFWFQFVGEVERIDREAAVYDRLAQSIQLI